MSGEKVKVKTENIYEAAWHIMCGAKVVSIETGKLRENKISKKGFTRVYKLQLENVDPTSIKRWQSGIAVGNICDYMNVRLKLKRKIRATLYKPTRIYYGKKGR